MAGIEKIKERILEDASKEKQNILNEAEKEADNILEKYRAKAEDVRKKILNEAKKEAEDEKRRILSMAQLEQRKIILKAKQDIIDEVFQKAERRLQEIPEKNYKNILYNMLLESVISGTEEIIVNKQDKNLITPDFIDKLNQELVNLGKAGDIRLSSENGDMIGGFILRSKDIEINATFDSLINLEREDLETKIAKILFEE